MQSPDSSSSICTAIMTFSRAAVTAARDESALMSTTSRPGELSMDDWSAILDPSRRIQKPLLERAVRYSHLNEEGKKKLFAAFAYTAIRDTSIDSHAARKFQVSKYYQPIEGELNKILERESGPFSRPQTAHNLLVSFNLEYGNISKRCRRRA